MTSAILRPITALLIATALVLTGNGLAGVLVPLRASAENFTTLEVGLVGTGYWVGLTLGCLLSPWMIGRVGHIRAFTAFTATATVVPLLFALTPSPVAWVLLRILHGACFAGIQMVIESWLTATSTSETRGRTLAIYTLLNLTVVTVGMQLVGLAPVTSFALFSLMAILLSLSALPIAMTLTPPPTPPRSTRIYPLWLLRVSPASVFACVSTGLVGGIFWGLTPLYGLANGLTSYQSATLMTVVVLSGAVAQWPIGILSDRYGRRPVLFGLSLVAAVTSALLCVAPGIGMAIMFIAAALYGTVAFAGYPIALAHAIDLVPQRRAVMVSSGLLLAFAAGAVIGPALGSVVIDVAGASMVFALSAVVHGLTVLAIVVRVSARPNLPAEYAEDYVLVPRTTPAIFEMDPRAADLDATSSAPDQLAPAPDPEVHRT